MLGELTPPPHLVGNNPVVMALQSLGVIAVFLLSQLGPGALPE